MFGDRGFIGVLFLLFPAIALFVGVMVIKSQQQKKSSDLLILEREKQMQVQDLQTENNRLELFKHQLESRDRIQMIAKMRNLSDRGDSIRPPLVLEVSQ